MEEISLVAEEVTYDEDVMITSAEEVEHDTISGSGEASLTSRRGDVGFGHMLFGDTTSI